MMSAVRLYLEPGKDTPVFEIPYGMPKVMDVDSEVAEAIAGDLRREGFDVTSVPL